MFDIGFSELLVIAVVALVVLGPERLPKAARFAGLWVRRARNQWDSVKQELERELHAEEIKRQFDDVKTSMRDTESQLRASGEAVRREAEQMRQDVAQHGDGIAAAAADDEPVMIGPAPGSPASVAQHVVAPDEWEPPRDAMAPPGIDGSAPRADVPTAPPASTDTAPPAPAPTLPNDEATR
ncbi:Sec-independent protein translocase protein TatB [Stenotrophomonas rhizophila]|uniref:Sec-independent protein translocase protein TatB n=1 Tax=Stenotrophomonas rhizophila TaxID=216778 RepID=A0AAW5PNV2_9GAMM|nr:Sec-independent protein translocase protein TatB [Stenotrophomonas rhizophila]MCS4281400.1 sec-independent protein translocase protein TatB [Stenotrophomonas rhizophila]